MLHTKQNKKVCTTDRNHQFQSDSHVGIFHQSACTAVTFC